MKAGSPYVIFAYGLTDPGVNEDITNHGTRRGSKVVNIISSTNLRDKNVNDNLEMFEYSISHVILKFIKYLVQNYVDFFKLIRLYYRKQIHFIMVNQFKYQQVLKKKDTLSRYCYLLFFFSNSFQQKKI